MIPIRLARLRGTGITSMLPASWVMRLITSHHCETIGGYLERYHVHPEIWTTKTTQKAFPLWGALPVCKNGCSDIPNLDASDIAQDPGFWLVVALESVAQLIDDLPLHRINVPFQRVPRAGQHRFRMTIGSALKRFTCVFVHCSGLSLSLSLFEPTLKLMSLLSAWTTSWHDRETNLNEFTVNLPSHETKSLVYRQRSSQLSKKS